MADDFKICGLCHYGVYEIARTLGLEINEMTDLTWEAPGLNHNIWLTHFIYDAQDTYPLLDRWIEEQGEEYWATHVAKSTHDAGPRRDGRSLYVCNAHGSAFRVEDAVWIELTLRVVDKRNHLQNVQTNVVIN